MITNMSFSVVGFATIYRVSYHVNEEGRHIEFSVYVFYFSTCSVSRLESDLPLYYAFDVTVYPDLVDPSMCRCG